MKILGTRETKYKKLNANIVLLDDSVVNVTSVDEVYLEDGLYVIYTKSGEVYSYNTNNINRVYITIDKNF
jgi:hypothetical protein